MALTLHGFLLPPLFLAGCIVLPLSAASAHQAAQRPRIKAQVISSERATLVGSVSPRAIAANDTGAVPADMPLPGVSLVLSRTPAQQTALDQLVAAQQNPASPLYHHWLTPEQYAAQFGVADADIAAISTWLEQQGFTVNSVSRGRNRISFSGTAAQVANAFGAPLHYYRAQPEATPRFAPSANLSIPAALSSVIESVQNLSSFRPHPQMVKPATQPMFTVGGNQLAFLTPPDVATVYNVTPVAGSGYNGAGQTLAIVGQSAVVAQDLVNFQTALGVPVKAQSLNLISGTGASAIVAEDEAEADLDLEYSSAMAPGASVAFYYVGNSGSYNVFDAINYVVDNHLASIISVSYALCEPDAGPAYISSIDATLEQAAVQGQTVIVASGDYGSVSCKQNMWDSVTVQNTPAVEYPASSPWVIALGGTEFPEADIGQKPVNSTFWGPAPNGDVVDTALSYIPEQVWNDAGGGGIDSGGGGISIYEPQPPWQTGVPGIPAGSFRLVPDIALAASSMYPGYLICSSDTAYFSITGSCTNGFRDAKDNAFNVIGGTSIAAPIFAGLLAVLNQAKGYTAGQGLINPTLYTLAANATTYASAFHDITSGNNACSYVAVCGSGPQNTDYLAGVGYDQATGLGSIDFANLVAAWPESTDATPVSTTTTLGVSTTSLLYATPLTLTATVTGGGAGSVTFLNNGVVLGYGALNSSGVATLIPTAYSLQPGMLSITASYIGTTGYAPSTSTATTVNVAAAPTVTTYTVSPANPTFGSTVTFAITVTSNGSPMTESGFVWFQSNGQGIGNGVMNYSPMGEATFSISTLPVGPNAITATFKGSGSGGYAPSTSTTTVVNVAAAPTSTTLSASPASPAFGSSVTLSATVSTSGSPATSGVVTFSSNGSSIGSATVNNGVATISLSTLPSGPDSITASFTGASNLAASTSNSVLITVAAAVPVIAATTTTLSASPPSVTSGDAVNFTATVASAGIPATSGVVSFMQGSNVIGSGTVNSSGVATVSLSTLPVGSNSISADYAGTTNYATSLSSAVTVSVAPVSPAVPVTINVPAPTPVSAGAATTASVNLSAGSSYSGTMNLTCILTGSPAGAQYLPTCSLNPTTLTVAVNAVATSTITVLTTSTTTLASRPSGITPWGFGGASAMAGLLIFCVPTRRRRTMSLLALLLVVLTLGAAGCGGGTFVSPTISTKSTTAGSYAFTVKATDASNPNTTASTAVTITVQ